MDSQDLAKSWGTYYFIHISGLSFDRDIAKTQNDVAAGRKSLEAHLLAENRDGTRVDPTLSKPDLGKGP